MNCYSYVLETDLKYMIRDYGPQHRLCPYCSANFDMIGRVENFNEDSDFLIKALGYEVRVSLN